MQTMTRPSRRRRIPYPVLAPVNFQTSVTGPTRSEIDAGSLVQAA